MGMGISGNLQTNELTENRNLNSLNLLCIVFLYSFDVVT
jgi:hypothetical protein